MESLRGCKNSATKSIPRKCAEVFQCDKGGLMYICLFCGEDFTKAFELEDHLLNHLINIVSILDNNKIKDREDNGGSEIFPESFNMAVKLETTELNQDEFNVFNQYEPFVTDHIIEEDATIKETWFTEGITCEHCRETFKCQGLKNLHYREKHKISLSHHCEQCNSGFDEEDSFKRHKELHEILNNPTCAYCQQIFEFQSDLNEHLQKTTEPDDTPTEVQIDPTVKSPRRRFTCDLCGKTLSSRTILLKHIRGNHEGRRYYCDICPFKAKDKANLYTHMRVHTKERRYSCEICGRKFAQSSYIKVHKRTHTGEKPFQCNICGLTRNSVSQLNTHIKEKHLNLPPKVYPCTVCDKKCSRRFQLKDHMRTHTGQKPYKCDKCDASFTNRKILAQHKKIHESIKAHECKYCGMKFAQSAGRRGHERRAHEDT